MKALDSAGSRSWPADTDARLNVVFVHGFQGDHAETWTWTEKLPWRRRLFAQARRLSLFDLLGEHAGVRCNYFSVAHRASIVSPTDMETAAGLVCSFLRDYVLPGNDLPVALIAHSFGGLACRRAILRLLDEPGRLRVAGLLLMGSPNSGTEIARVAKALGSAAGGNMAPYDESLATLNRAWAAQVVNGGDPDLDPEKRAPLVCWAAVGSEDRVVPSASAAALSSYANVSFLNKGHIAMVKAASQDDPTFRLIDRFLDEVDRFARRRDGEWAIKHLTHRLRRVSLASRWVREESTRISLAPSDLPHRLACRVENQRRGGMGSRTFSIAIWLSGHQPTQKVDFDWEIGQGGLDETAFSLMVDGAMTALEQYFQVTRLAVTQHGRSGEFTFVGRENGSGWSLLSYAAPSWYEDADPYVELELHVASFIDQRQGWMFYALPRTVAERLEVTFEAPFRYGTVARLGKGSSVIGPTPQGTHFITRARVEGPVAIGRNIVWVFHARADGDNPTGTGGA